MRRLLLIAFAIAVLAGTTASVAYARISTHGIASSSAPVAAPFRVPAAMPAADPAQADTYGFRSAAQIGADLQRDAGAPAAADTSSGASATVTVTAVVLPVAIIVVDHGHVDRIVTNTPDRGAREVIFTVRRGSESGPATTLDAATWAEARAALRDAHAGTGTVWSR